MSASCSISGSGTGIVDTLTTRLRTFLSGGCIDPTGTGYVYHQLLNGLKDAQLVGPSSYKVAVNSTNSIPVYAFFANQDSAYSVAVIILKWGWISGVLILGLTVALIVMLFKTSRLVKNDYARYFSYSVAVLFAVKTALSLVSCFVIFLGEADIPMIGPFGAVVDLVLLVSVVTLCNE